MVRPWKQFRKGDAVRFTAAAEDQRYRLSHSLPDMLMVFDAEPDYVRLRSGGSTVVGCYSYRLELAEGPW